MAQKLKFGKGTWATKEGSTLAYNDENNNYKPLPFTTTRNSIGTRVNKEGLIEVVGKDKLRIDYTDTDKGVALLEPSSTNVISNSNNFSSYSFQGMQINSSSIKSPDGTFNASEVLETATNGNHGLYSTIAITIGDTYTVSCFVKKLNRRYFGLQNWYGANRGCIALFDLDEGKIVYTKALGSGYAISDVKINALSDGWFKVSAVMTTNHDASYIGVVSSDSLWSSGTSYENAYDGDTTKGFYLYGFQYENLNYVTSYIPTSGSTVQRAADTASGAGNSAVFNDSEGVLFADISALVGAGGGTRRIEVSNAVDASQYVRLQIANGDGSLYAIVNNGSQQFLFNATSFDATLSNKISLKYKQNDFSLFLNGFEVGSSNVGNTFANGILTQASFSSTNSEFYGKTKELGYYNTALTDAELETLTSYRSLSELVTELNLNTL